MEVIKLDIETKEDLYERYNKNEVTESLINYIIESTRRIPKNETIQIIINKNKSIKDNCTELIKKGLKTKYNQNIYKKKSNDKKQLFMLLGGIIALILTTILGDTIFKEISLIGGWVLIWETIDSDLFEDSQTKKENKLIQKLIDSEYVEDRD